MKTIGLQDVKTALKDHRFRESLPDSLKNDLAQYLQNPSCPCNMPFYKKLLREGKNVLLDYFKGSVIEELKEDEEAVKLATNYWQVINCHVSELEGKLKSLPIGRKQIAITRYEDQVTVVVNELDLAF
jgi:hypothetical protein